MCTTQAMLEQFSGGTAALLVFALVLSVRDAVRARRTKRVDNVMTCVVF